VREKCFCCAMDVWPNVALGALKDEPPVAEVVGRSLIPSRCWLALSLYIWAEEIRCATVWEVHISI